MKKVIRIIFFIILLIIILYLIIEKYQENKIKNKVDLDFEVLTSTIQEHKNEYVTSNKYPKEDVIYEYKGYVVSAKLTIPKIQLETYILQNYSEQALKISVTKFFGVNANQVGNFCVAGHNFKNMFKNLKKLEIGDTFKISDNQVGIIEYKIYDIYIVEPEDVRCLSQDTNQTREVTLITCTADSKKRIIVKGAQL